MLIVNHYNIVICLYLTNVGFSLFTMAKNSEDALQIVEQILPMFQPDYTISLNVMANYEIVRDVPIVLNDVAYEDTYDAVLLKDELSCIHLTLQQRCIYMHL